MLSFPWGEGNSYGHPTEDTLSRLRDADVDVFRTDLQGDIICTSDGQTVSFTVERNADADVFGGIGTNSTETTEATVITEEPETSEETTAGVEYIVNTNTGKFHYPYCHSVDRMKESNKWYYTGTREELIEMGYDPCGNCHP